MIAVQDLAARADGAKGATSFLRAATFSWERGVLAIVGTPHDGTTALLSALAGRSRATTGRVTVDGRAPAEVARSIAWVPADAVLPDALRVDEVCELACLLRGGAPVAARDQLAPLGLVALASRRVRSLSPAESRAVLLAIALASSARVLLVEEPLAGLDPAAPALVVEALRARAAAGAAVVVTTASVRDATRLADQLGVLTQGVFAHLPPALAHVGPGGARLRVIVSAATSREASPFVAALASEPAVASVETVMFAGAAAAGAAGARGAAAIVVSGPDLLALARAVSAAAHRSGTVVDAIESQVMPLDAIRAALAAPRMGALPSIPPAAAAPPAPPAPTSVAPPAPPAPPAPASVAPPAPPAPPTEGGGA